MTVMSTQAAGYPNKPVRLLVPFPPGGSTEFTAKTLAGQLGKVLGQPFVVENKVGEFGIVALRQLVNADEYTLLVGSVNTNSITPVVFRNKILFDYEATVMPVSRLAEFPSLLVTRTSVPAKTVREFIAYAKNHWGKIKNGTDWIGSYPDIDAVILSKVGDFEVVNLPKSGGADGLLAAVADGEIDMVFLNVRTAGMGIKAGKVKALAVTGTSRLAGFPDVLTMGESGFQGIGTSHWHGLFASSRTPAEVVRQLHGTVVRALNADETKAVFETVGARVAPSSSPEQFAAEIKAEMAQWEKVRPDIQLAVE
jgi:tripartite-type tricarboxylate transporter receptor subunit TctC